MIDTIVLTLKPDQFKIIRPEKFTPNAKSVMDILGIGTRKEGVTKAVCNPSKADAEQGLCMPRMTLTGRVDKGGSYNVTLRVEVSLPKLVYGNNFDELTDQDFALVLDTLSDRMASQGVISAFHDLRFAAVSAIHYGKNILLSDYITCSGVLRALSKVNVNGWLDVAKQDYRNDGHLYKIHSNDFELAFYDKVKDLEKAKKSPKRAYEQDVIIQQTFLNRTDFDNRKQVLRIEARLGSRRKIRDVLEKVKGGTAMALPELTFGDLYSQCLAKSIVCHYWKPYKRGMQVITASAGKSVADLYQQIAFAKPKAKDAQVLKLVAAYTIIEEVGWPGLKSIWNSNPRSLARLRKEVEALDLASSIAIKGFEQIERSLQAFDRIKLEQLFN